MRRMYSKEQLQKLIDEVSRLIAIEELDKVVPVPSLAKAGYYMAVNSAGTGYELVASPEQSHLYFHPIVIVKSSGETQYAITMTIINNVSTPYTLDTIEDFLDELYTLVGNKARLLLGGGYGVIGSCAGLGKSSNVGTNDYFIDGMKVDGTYHFIQGNSLADLLGTPTALVDGVNQIL